MHLNIIGYVDPGSGALIWQMLAAAAVGVLFYFRRFFQGLGRFFRRLFGKEVQTAAPTPPVSEPQNKA